MSAEKFKRFLESHKIFESLDQNGEELVGSTRRANQLIHMHDGCLYAWSNRDCCFYFSNFGMSIDDNESDVQKLLCSPPPLFQVKNVVFNEPCTLVALIGSRGASVVTLPQKWQQNLEGDEIFCKCTPVGERFFSTCIMVQLSQAAWHPGSTNHCHLCLLVSDNTFRIYDVNADVQNPMQMHNIGDGNMGSSRFSVASSFSISAAIGETVVSFAFALPIEMEEKRRKILQARGKEASLVTLYPVYLLQGNGEVLILLTTVTDNRYRKGHLCGPLTMQPAAEDNYGVDACSILVLDSSPAIVVIATATGKLHHCITLATNYDSDDENFGEEVQSTSSVPASVLSAHSKALASEFSPPTLYVYETVVLEFVPEEDDDDEEDEEFMREFVNRTVTLYSDPLLYSRYHCCTTSGIHAVVVPWVDKLVTLLQADDEDKSLLAVLSRDQPCVVEHIVCTEPIAMNAACAIQGITFAINPLFGPSLLCLTADSHCSVIPLLTVFKPLPPLLPKNETVVSSEDYALAITSDFEGHIRSILKKDSSQPLLRYDASFRDVLVDSEVSRLVSRVTRILRSEYILKQKLAQDAILKRVEFLKQQKMQQMKEITELEEQKFRLTDVAGELAERYEDCIDCQERLSKRLEEVLKHAQSKVPVLSKAEIDMGKQLKTMSERMEHLENKIRQVEAKNDYQKQRVGDEKPDTSLQQKAPADPSKVQKYKEILYEEGQKIENLVKMLNRLKVMVDT